VSPPSLTLESCLEYARISVAVLYALKSSDGKMTYQQFAKAIGLMPANGEWHIKYREMILKICGAVERLAREDDLEFEHVVNQETGEPGAGFYKNHQIVKIAD
jgi:hypothetical protein